MQNDFSRGSVSGNIIRLAVPLMLAQLVNVLYNVVDRVFIGHIGGSTLPLTGVGLCMPVITVISAFSGLFGMGGAPICSIARGRGDLKEAEQVQNTSFVLLVGCGLLLTIVGELFLHPILTLFGASADTLPYAASYLRIYLVGTIFVMIALGMNYFINTQGFAGIGMLTVSIGALLNLILDPLFIFGFNMGVSGAALATICSQAVSAIWALYFLFSKRAILRLRPHAFRWNGYRVRRIIALGMSNFIALGTNGVVQIACNSTLQTFGGDLYVGVMTVLTAVREVVQMPISGLNNGSQPVMSFNYGARQWDRVKKAIRFSVISGIIYATVCWAVLFFFPAPFVLLFNDDPDLVAAAIPALHLYFFGYFMMSLQFVGQSVFVALGRSKQAIFFSLFRKIIIVVPLTLLLPHLFGLGVTGVFLAEAVSNFVGGTACFVTMYFTLYRRLGKEETHPKPHTA